MIIRNAVRASVSSLTLILATSGYAAEPIANAGTLTCTLAPSDKVLEKARSEATVSCHFVSISGEDFDLSGRIVRLAAEAERSAKIVISWSVVAPNSDIAPEVLSGRFTGKLLDAGSANSESKSPEGTLYGADQSGIELRPLDNDPATLPDAGLTVLELDIVTVKV